MISKLIPVRDFILNDKGEIIKWLNPFISQKDGVTLLEAEKAQILEVTKTHDLVSDYFKTLSLGIQVFLEPLKNSMISYFNMHDLDAIKEILSSYPFTADQETIKNKLYEFLKIELLKS